MDVDDRRIGDHHVGELSDRLTTRLSPTDSSSAPLSCWAGAWAIAVEVVRSGRGEEQGRRERSAAGADGRC